MTVTNYQATQVSNEEAGIMNESVSGMGRLFLVKVTFNQTAIGSANSTMELAKLPPGKFRYVGHLSKIYTTAGGTGRTMDVGLGAYTNPAGTAVAASEAAIHSAKDVSAATGWSPGISDELDDAAGEDGTLLINTRDGVKITGKIESGTVPANFKVTGVLAFMR